jgi:hypothetical protein
MGKKMAKFIKKRKEMGETINSLGEIFRSAINLFNEKEYKKAFFKFNKCFMDIKKAEEEYGKDFLCPFKQDCLIKKDMSYIYYQIEKIKKSEREEKGIDQSECLKEGVNKRLIPVLNELLSYTDSEVPKEAKKAFLSMVCHLCFSQGLIDELEKIVLDHKEILDYIFCLDVIKMFLINNELAVERTVVKELLKILVSVNNDPDVSCFIVNFFIKNKEYDKEIFSDDNLKKHVEVMQRATSDSNSKKIAECYGVLAICYQDGIVLPKDEIKATDYYLKAAEGGRSEATLYLASLYLAINQKSSSDAQINSKATHQKIEDLLREIVEEGRKDVNLVVAKYFLALFICIRNRYINITYSTESTAAAVFSNSLSQIQSSEMQELTRLLNDIVKADQDSSISAKKILLMIDPYGKYQSKSETIDPEKFYQEMIDKFNDPLAMLELAKILLQKGGNDRAIKIRVISLCARASQLLGEDVQKFWKSNFLDKPIQDALESNISELPPQTNQIELFSNEAMQLPSAEDLKSEEGKIITLLEKHSRLIKRYPDEIHWRVQHLQKTMDILESVANDVEPDVLIRGINAVSRSDIRLTEAPFSQSVKKLLSYLTDSSLNSRQQIKLLWAISLFKPRHLPNDMVNDYLGNIENLLRDEMVTKDVYLLSSLIYALAMIDCDLRLSNNFSLADEKIPDSLIEEIFAKLNQCCKQATVEDLTSIYRSYNYFRYCHKWERGDLKCLVENNWPSLNSTIHLGEEFTKNQSVTISKMQKEVADCLRQTVEDTKEVEEEKFVGGCRVDIQINRHLIEVNGPMHYQFNSQGIPVADSAKEQVRMELLKAQKYEAQSHEAQSYFVHQVSYKDWDSLPSEHRYRSRWLKVHMERTPVCSYANAVGKNSSIYGSSRAAGPSTPEVEKSRTAISSMSPKK